MSLKQIPLRVIIKRNGFTYDGFLKNEKPEGYGKIFGKGIIYKGYWQNGLPNGYGIFTSKNFTYIGYWKDGKIVGEIPDFNTGINNDEEEVAGILTNMLGN
tara:strand:- start:690 stop:992 length:303 start_codon:yes stop_codon:yes gene_type:complete